MICEFRTVDDDIILTWKIDVAPRVGDRVMITPNEFTHLERDQYLGTSLKVTEVVHVLTHTGVSIDQTALIYVSLVEE